MAQPRLRRRPGAKVARTRPVCWQSLAEPILAEPRDRSARHRHRLRRRSRRRHQPASRRRWRGTATPDRLWQRPPRGRCAGRLCHSLPRSLHCPDHPARPAAAAAESSPAKPQRPSATPLPPRAASSRWREGAASALRPWPPPPPSAAARNGAQPPCPPSQWRPQRLQQCARQPWRCTESPGGQPSPRSGKTIP